MEISPNSIGIFYPRFENELLKLFKRFSRKKINYNSRLVVVPHAGYEFSGRVAFNTYQYLDKTVKNVIVIAPALYKNISGTVSCDAKSFKTPLGSIDILPFDTQMNNNIFATEPSFSVQLPFIKYLLPEAKVIPILYGCEDYNNIMSIIENCIHNSAVVIVSNLSRFVPEKESIKLDSETLRKIERLDVEDLDMELADGAIGICAAIKYAKINGFKFIMTAHSNSSKVNDDTSNVVGYGGWYLTR